MSSYFGQKIVYQIFKNKFFMKLTIIKKNLIIFFGLIFFSIFFFRGRLGSDDLQVFNFIFSFSNSSLNLFDFTSNLSTQNYYDYNYIPDERTVHHRTFWIFHTFVIYNFFFPIINFFTDNPFFLLQYVSGLFLSFYTCLSFYLVFRYFEIKNLKYYESIFLTISIFFGTGLIAFFTGAYIESLIVLLIILRFTLKNTFFIDFIIVLIKPYYLILVFLIEIQYLEYKKFKKIFLYFSFLTSLYIFYRFFLFPNVGASDYLNAFSNFTIDFLLIKKNIFNIFFSSGYGLIFNYIIPIILIFFGFRKKETSIKIIGVFLLLIFFSFFTSNHGQSPGGRYFLPCIFIFLNEIYLGFNVLKRKNKKMLFTLFFLVLINLPVLEYRNFSLPIYIQSSSFTGKVASFNTGGTHDWFENYLNKIEFHPSIFAINTVYHKVMGNKEMFILNQRVKLDDIYPMTSLMRLNYLQKHNSTKWISNNLALKKLIQYSNFYIQLYLTIIFLLIFLYFILMLKIYRNLKININDQ